MSNYSQAVRERFLSQLALAQSALVLEDLEAHPAIRLRGRQREVSAILPSLCPLTAACYHSVGVLFGVEDYRFAAEELAIPRGMASVIAGAADGAATSPWRQRCFAWWRAQVLGAVEAAHAP
jgi:hypothetical protein